MDDSSLVLLVVMLLDTLQHDTNEILENFHVLILECGQIQDRGTKVVILC
jgi:hypothetical protein